MMRGASGDECGNLVLGQEYNRPAEAGVLKKPRGSDLRPFRLGSPYQEQDVTAKCKQNWINHHERMDNTRLPKHALEEKKIVDAPGNDGNASMPEQVKRPNTWRKTIMIIFLF
jgi:hypothetical protein